MKNLILKHVIIITFLFLPAATYAAKQSRQIVPDRISGLVKSLGLNPIRKMDSTTILQLSIGLSLRNMNGLHVLIQQLYDPSSPRYRHFLTPTQFTDEFGPTKQDYHELVAFVLSNGFKVTRTYSNQMLVDVTAPVATVDKAFHINMMMYKHPTQNRLFYAPNVQPSVDLGIPLAAIGGLSNYIEPRPVDLIDSTEASVNTPLTGSGPSDVGNPYMGGDFRAAYVPSVADSGRGQKVGQFQFTDFNTSDITYYENFGSLPNVPVERVYPDGGQGTFGTSSETCLDIETVISMAPGLDSVIEYIGDNPDDILAAMAADSSVKQLSSSWTYNVDANAENLFLRFQSQGQSFFTASGDWDAIPPGGSNSTPCSDPNITSVGGTTLYTTGPGGTYVSENVWNWGIEENEDGVGSTGGYDVDYPIPSYQLGVSDITSIGGSTAYRNFPDVALTADNIYVRYGGADHRQGGTSAAAPLWAGFMALVNQQATALGDSNVGFINPAVYSIGESPKYASDFHDVAQAFVNGVNINNNTWSQSPNQFYGASGYDLCTGWGSPNGANLINDLAGPISGTIQSSVTLGGILTISGNVTVPAGVTLTISPGATVEIASGASINVNGVLDAIGSQSSPITFTSSGSTSPGSWGSIILSGSGADNSIMEHCDIDYGTDVESNNTSNVTFKYCSIKNNSSYGISTYNSSYTYIQYDTIANANVYHGILIQYGSVNDCYYDVIYKTNHNQQGAAIQYSGSSGTDVQNDIEYYNWGIAAIWGGTVSSYWVSNPDRNNRITNCLFGLMVYRNSIGYLGNSQNSVYSWNSVYNNSDYNAAVGYYYPSYANALYAYSNWWGSPTPDQSKFYVSSASEGYFGYPLPTDPWNGYSLPSGSEAAGGSQPKLSDAAAKSISPVTAVDSTPVVNNLQDSLMVGMELRAKNQLPQARSFFESFIARHPEDPLAYAGLYASVDSTSVPAVLDFFKVDRPSQPNIRETLLSSLYEMDQQPDKAEETNDSIIARFPNTALEVRAETSNMLIDLYDRHDLKGAESILTNVQEQASLINPMELQDAEEAVALRTSSIKPSSNEELSIQSGNIPHSYSLSQNYPNPFNPTTVIEYTIPKESHVTLKIYDVLGQEVETLVDQDEQVGRYSINFSGSSLASGVYFYRLVAGSHVITKKMLLLK